MRFTILATTKYTVALNRCTMLYKHHHYIFLSIFSNTLNRNFISIKHYSPPPLPLLTSILLSVSEFAYPRYLISGMIQYLPFGVWHFTEHSVSKVHSCCSVYYNFIPFYGLIIFYHIQPFVHTFICSRTLGLFPLCGYCE